MPASTPWQKWFAWRPVKSADGYGRDVCVLWLTDCWRRRVNGKYEYTWTLS
jgi:hypothetical protein